MRLSRYGIDLDVPAGWDARLFRRAAVAGESPNPVLHAATFALPPVRGDFGTGAVERMAPRDVLVVLFEYDPSAAGTALFAARGRPRPEPGHFSPRQLQRTLPGQSGRQYFYVESGRAFCLFIVLGSHLRRESLVPLARAALDGITVHARSAA